jgi:nucleotide-binding universal stress UspA family protein
MIVKVTAMPYATVMVYVDADEAPEQRVRLAAGLADKFNATLIGMSAFAIRPAFMAEGAVVQDLMQTDIKELRGKLAGRGSWFRTTAGAVHRKLEWRAVLDFPNEALASEARSADLVVIGQTRGPGDAYSTLDPGGAVLKIGRPTLIVPNGVEALRAEHVVIGWKDSREARRAVQDAIPFLQEATRVTVVEICESGEEGAAQEHIDDVARYLTRHRISGGPRVIIHQEGPGAAQLIRLAQDEGADLIVAGAYGHSRLGEWMFGGMTRDLLATSPICCLMSH